ncbi:MAG: hypothetical protein EXR28_15960 [Betaproteobacteria bacterium]|nr:hypothetical protein [Betaproteobacteria bacterium]
MADGTVFEERGLQAVALITDSFHNTARSMARVRGFPDYRYAAVENPIGSLGAEGIKQRARQALPQVLEILGITDIRGLGER